MARNAPFRIAHVSDLHLTEKDPDQRTEPKLFGKLTGMNDAFRAILKTDPIQKCDLLLVTGDVADRGGLESWRIFWDALSDARIADRVAVIPGNHDVCCLGARIALDQKKSRDEDMMKAKTGIKLGSRLSALAYDPTSYPWTLTPDPRAVVFGLNSNNLGNYSATTNAMGALGYFQLATLASKLHKYRDVPVKMVALHHSPNIPGAETAHKRGTRAFSVFDRLAHQIPEGQRHALHLLSIAHRVRLVVHGHLHMAEDRDIGGVRFVGAPATTEPHRCTSSEKTYRFWTYTIQGDGGRVRTELKSVTI